MLQRMVHKKVIVVFAAMVLAAAGCATLQRELKRSYWELKKSLREPGEKLVELPEDARREYKCKLLSLPFARIVKYEVLPLEAYQGEEINQHFEYVMCPARPAQVLRGTLYRRVYFKGRMVFQDVTRRFELKPGKWAVDAFIKIPEEARPGVYYVEVYFRGSITLKKGKSIVVKKKAGEERRPKK